jgi:hypothetical protein
MASAAEPIEDDQRRILGDKGNLDDKSEAKLSVSGKRLSRVRIMVGQRIARSRPMR